MKPLPQAADVLTALSLRHTLRLWKQGVLSPVKVFHDAWRSYSDQHCDARSAQFAYYSLLALCPLLILLIALVAHLPVQGVLESSLEAAGGGLPKEMYDVLDRQIKGIQLHSTWKFIGANLFLLALGGARVVLTVIAGLNLAYGVPETRRFWQTYGMAALFTLAASLLALLAMVLMVAGPILSQWVAAQGIDAGWLNVMLRRGVRWSIVCGCLWIGTSTIYWWGPNLRQPWSWLSPGSAFAVGGWVAASQGFRLYVENLANYNETYGALGGVIVLIIWLDISGAMLLFGGHVNAAIHRAAALPASPTRAALP